MEHTLGPFESLDAICLSVCEVEARIRASVARRSTYGWQGLARFYYSRHLAASHYCFKNWASTGWCLRLPVGSKWGPEKGTSLILTRLERKQSVMSAFPVSPFSAFAIFLKWEQLGHRLPRLLGDGRNYALAAPIAKSSISVCLNLFISFLRLTPCGLPNAAPPQSAQRLASHSTAPLRLAPQRATACNPTSAAPFVRRARGSERGPAGASLGPHYRRAPAGAVYLPAWTLPRNVAGIALRQGGSCWAHWQ